MIKVHETLYINPTCIAMVSQEPSTGNALIYFKKPLYFLRENSEINLDSSEEGTDVIIDDARAYEEAELDPVSCISIAKDSSKELFYALDKLSVNGNHSRYADEENDDEDEDEYEVWEYHKSKDDN